MRGMRNLNCLSRNTAAAPVAAMGLGYQLNNQQPKIDSQTGLSLIPGFPGPRTARLVEHRDAAGRWTRSAPGRSGPRYRQTTGVLACIRISADSSAPQQIFRHRLRDTDCGAARTSTLAAPARVQPAAIVEISCWGSLARHRRRCSFDTLGVRRRGVIVP